MDETQKEKIAEQAAIALEEVISCANLEGYMEAKKKYSGDYKKVLKKGRKQGVILTLVFLAVSGITAFKMGVFNKLLKKSKATVYEVNEKDIKDDINYDESEVKDFNE